MGESDLLDRNRRFYDTLWSESRPLGPERFNTWLLAQELAAGAKRRLELGPGLRPRLPIAGTCFADISSVAASHLRESGGIATVAEATSLPFPDRTFDLVAAFDIVEHIEDEEAAFRELSRVLRPGGELLVATPLHPSRWTEFDALVGHCRRYDPDRLVSKLEEEGLTVVSSAVFGMQPRSGLLLRIGVWWMRNRRRQAMWWYDRVFVPMALRLGKELRLVPGLIDTRDVDEILLVCRKGPA
jgi:SAM-dependent methyltransferase